MIGINYIWIRQGIILDAHQPACPAVAGGKHNILRAIASYGLDEASRNNL